MRRYQVTLLGCEADSLSKDGKHSFSLREKHSVVAEDEMSAVQAAMRRSAYISKIWGFNVEDVGSL